MTNWRGDILKQLQLLTASRDPISQEIFDPDWFTNKAI